MLSVMNKKDAISELMSRNNIHELYANVGFSIEKSSRDSVLCVPKKGGRYDISDSIFLGLIDILKRKVSVCVTFRDIATDHFGYTLIWRSGVWYV